MYTFSFFRDIFVMDVLRPTIIPIGNRRYRKYTTSSPGETKIAHDELPGKMKIQEHYHEISAVL